MKQKQFLLVYFLIFIFIANVMLGQTLTFPGFPTTYTQITPKSGNATYDRSGDYHIGKDTTDTDVKWAINRSRFHFDISNLPPNARIISVKCKYLVNSPSSGHKSFAVTDNQLVPLETDKQAWTKIPNSTIEGELKKSTGNFKDNSTLTARINTARAGDGTFYLGVKSNNESAKESYANIDLDIEIEYEILKLTVKNKLGTYSDGEIGVGINSLPIEPEDSPFLTQDLNYGNTIKLHAYENQDLHDYIWIWNDGEAPDERSEWEKEGGAASNDISNKLSQTTAYSVVKKDAGAKLIANLKRVCNVTQKYEFLEAGVSGTIKDTTQIEGNTITFTADATKTANGLTGYFYGWKEDASTNTTSTKTITEHSTFTAQYKAVARSNNATAYQNNGQRKVVQTESGTMFRVYDSMNEVWIEKSTDGGSSWSLANNGQPLSNLPGTDISPSSKIDSNPSITIAPYNEDPFYCYVVYVREYGGGKFMVVVKLDENGKISTYGYLVKATENNAPVISANSFGTIMVVAKRQNGLYCSIFDSTHDLYYNSYATYSIPNTNSGSCNPTITTDFGYVGGYLKYYFHLAWQQTSASGHQVIKYARLYWDEDNNYFNSDDYKEVSDDGMFYEENTTPSISSVMGNTTVAWVNGMGMWNYREVHVRTKSSGTYWYVTKFLMNNYYYDEEISVSINNIQSDDEDNEYMVGYAAKSDKLRYYLPESDDHEYLVPYNYDDYVQVCNGFEYARETSLETFNTSSQPYVFHTSTIDDGLLSKSKSTTKEKAINGRMLTIKKGSTYLKIKLNTPIVDDTPIDFVEIEDSVETKSKEKMISMLTTKPFELTNMSDFTFSLENMVYRVEKGDKKVDSNIKLDVVLLDAVSNKRIGVLKQVKSNALTDKGKNEFQYKVNTKGIGNKKVKLMISLDANSVDVISIAKTSTLNDKLEKASETEVAFNETLGVSDYALSQNYPNPFNPSTTIKYQIPNDGMVSLKIYDITGQEVKTLVNQAQTMGRYEVSFDASNLSSGVYLYRLTSGSFAKSMKMLLLK